MPTVTVPHQFFKDERTKLYNWKPDFWRELLQNSIDAGSKNIQISLTDSEEGLLRIEFIDDGCGMTLGVLEEVYFALGATTKNDSSSIGGFGRARIMTCFGHEKYEIETLSHFVEGRGANYDIHQSNDYIDGCKVRVWMSEITKSEMLLHLHKYLGRCSLSINGIQVTIDGELFNKYLDRGRRVKELSFAKIYVNKATAKFTNEVIFRVNGLTMFSRYSNCNKQVIVEIDTDKARSALSSNRNGFTSEVSNEVDRWFDELAVDDMSALRRRTETREMFLGDGYFVSKNKKTTHADGVAIQPTAQDHSIAVTSADKGVRDGLTTAPVVSDLSHSYIAEPMPGDPFVRNLFNVFIINETCDSSMDQIVNRYKPKNWTYQVRSDKGENVLYKRGRESYRLLIAYKIAIQEALKVMMDIYGGDDMAWTLGWVFSDRTEGCHLEYDGCHIFCLNPADGNKSKYKLTKRADILALIAIAKHEAAHAKFPFHNESWGNTLTAIDKRMDTQKVIRRIKETLNCLEV